MLDEQPGQMGRVDRAIHEIARQITEGAPDAGFKARVLARIETRDDRSWSWRWVWALSPVAVAVAVTLAVLIGRAPQVRLKPDPTYAPQVRLQADVTLPSGVVVSRPNGGSGGGPNRVRPMYQRLAYVGRALSGPAAVSDFAPIDIEPLGVEAMDLTPLGIDAMESIEVPRLALAPLEVPAIGER